MLQAVQKPMNAESIRNSSSDTKAWYLKTLLLIILLTKHVIPNLLKTFSVNHCQLNGKLLQGSGSTMQGV